jgi:hypothetical protein
MWCSGLYASVHNVAWQSICICTEVYNLFGPAGTLCVFFVFHTFQFHMNLKIEADALNRRRRRFCVPRAIYHIYQERRW